MLYHITSKTEWDRASASGAYRPEAFAREGFIHCSYAGQVEEVATRLFRGTDGLVLLEIDRARLSCPVVDENLEGGVERYPHLYGPLPVGAVVHVHDFPCREDGTFGGPPGRANE